MAEVDIENPGLYDLIGVAPGAVTVTVVRAYHQALHRNHPDHGGDPETCARIIAAGHILLDPVRRRQYDTRHGYPTPGSANVVSRQWAAALAQPARPSHTWLL